MSPPHSLAEWMVGQNLPRLPDPKPRKKHRQRDIVKIEVTTDDETEQDIVKVSYPRSGKWNSNPSSARKQETTVVKKVRFENEKPKSALKKTVKTTSSSALEEPSDTSTDSETESVKKSKAKKSSKCPHCASEGESSDSSKSKKSKTSEDADSSADSQHPKGCRCKACEKAAEVQKIGRAHV